MDRVLDRQAAADLARENAELRRQLEACRAELDEARRQQTATAEVLGVINSSPGELAPVFDAMLDKAMQLCGLSFGALWTYDGEYFHAVALRGVPVSLAEALRQPLKGDSQTGLGRLAQGAPLVHFEDLAAEQITHPGAQATAAAGARTFLAIPLRRKGALLGAFTTYRHEVRPFSAKEIALFENFAAQAVIAMENARLLTETREALDQQTATAEVLQVINSSPGKLAPVFDTLVETAARLCGTDMAGLAVRDGDTYRYVATRSLDPGWDAYLSRLCFTPERGTVTGRTLLERRVVHIADLAADPEHTVPEIVTIGRIKTLLGVPLLRKGEPIGVLALGRQHVQPFTERQIALLQNFAAQAVIAIENARLLGELRARTRDLEQSLEYQTAISDVLRVISGSAFDLEPVLQTVVRTAIRLCRADQAVLYRNVGGEYRWAAGASLVPAYEEIERAVRIRPGTGTLVGRAALEARTVHILDARTDPLYAAKEDAQVGGVHTMLGVPLLRDGEPIGVIGLARQRVEAYAEKEIELVRTFADQAVIAIENTRLLTELREALGQQTATAEVLQVINRSPGDLAPVFEAMLEKALGLCDAAFGVLWTYDGERVHAAALRGVPPAFAEFLTRTPHPVGSDNAHGRLVNGEPVVHVADLEADAAHRSRDPIRRALVELGNGRVLLAVPLRKDDAFLGIFTIYRQEPRPFSDKQIGMLQNFAAQAVIAMENARLLTETREALEQQTATAEVLQVINSSPGDLAPVFNAMLEKALGLCDASFGILSTREGDEIRRRAARNLPPALSEYLNREPPNLGLNTFIGRAFQDRRLIHVRDILEEEPYRRGVPLAVATYELANARTMLWVPLLKGASAVGMFTIYRTEVRPFTDKQIALIESFAAQAVIAMDNARLLNEIRQRQAELRVTFDNMGDGVVMFDEDLRLAAWNRNFQELLNLPDALLAARPTYTEYLRILAERGEFGSGDVEGELSRRLAEADQELRLERTRPDGRVIEVRRNAVPDGGFVLIYSDITERKEAEARLRTARDTAETALRELEAAQANLIHAEKMASLGQLTAGIAHEIKNPLNFVNNFAGLSVELLDELKTTAAPAIATLDAASRSEIGETFDMLTGNLDKIAAHGRRADGIVQSMLAHSRGSSGERQPVDLNALVEEALNLAYHGARAREQDFTITLERDFDSAARPIELVPQDITRALLNLIGNGFYAATRRRRETADAVFRPVLKVATRELDAAVEIRVRDNGPGISPDIQDKLFQPFFTTKPTGEGTGLGLSISYDIVAQQHGGTITVDSEPGQYTEFIIRLPRLSGAGERADFRSDGIGRSSRLILPSPPAGGEG